MFQKIQNYTKDTFSSFEVHNYRLYFFGQGISLTGTWMQTIAQTWLVLELTHSGTAIGLLVAAQFLPILLLGPIGGVIADRFPKRKLLYITQSSAMLLAFVLGLLVLTHVVQVWMVFVLASMLGLVTVFDNPARQTFVVEMVGPERLINAVTLNGIALNLARVIGPSVAAVLIAGVGMAYCFLLNAASYVVVLTSLALMHASELHPAKHSEHIRGQLQEGLRYVWNHPVLRFTIFMLVIIGTFTYEFQVVMPLLASRTFHGGASTYALFMAAMSVGSVIGGVLAAGRLKAGQKSLVRASALFGVCMLVSSLAPGAQFEAVLLVGVGFGSIIFSALANSTLQLATSPEMRGRVMSLWAVAFLGTTPLGGPVVGWICDHASPRMGLAVGGVAAILAAVVGWLSLRGERTSGVTTSPAVE
ncbi:MAG TPA: MFS transporter [Candidatus Saccharimonadia bacterium]|jgi:MFS family permease